MLSLLLALLCIHSSTVPAIHAVGQHSNNWAVIVDTSRFWFNYRHDSNALSIYTLLKEAGMPDDQIILMLADDAACNPRNPHAGRVFNTDDRQTRRNVYGEHVEVDYRGSEVTSETFFRLLTDRLPHGTPRSKRLLTNERSNVLLFMTGHGGDNFLKFQDSEEINAHDLADAVSQMHERRRFHEMLIMVDTCQAASMFEKINVRNVLTVASSSKGESSYSYHVDDEIGVAVIDRFTFNALEFLSKTLREQPESSMADFADSWDTEFLHSRPVLDTHLMGRAPAAILLADFFTNRQPVVHPATSESVLPAVRAGTRVQLGRPEWAKANPRLLIDKQSSALRPVIAAQRIKVGGRGTGRL